MLLCEACSRVFKDESPTKGSFISELDEEKQAEDLLCPKCGTASSTVLKKGILGCSECVNVFRREMALIWKRGGRPSNYTGSPPAKPDKAVIEAFRKLDTAIMDENYELALQLRIALEEGR